MGLVVWLIKKQICNIIHKHIGHSIVPVHCVACQEGLCTECVKNHLEVLMKIATAMVNFVTSHALNERQFKLSLKEVDLMQCCLAYV
jgi:hypothetical protein